jgi:AcrR family transcriptional regulator
MTMTSPGTALSKTRIVETALALARVKGMAGVSMRLLGRELGVQPMSLYHHVPSRAALMVLMADRSVSQLVQPDPGLPWEQRLVDLLMQTYRAGVEDPAVFPVLAAELLSSGRPTDLEPESNAASAALIKALLDLLGEAGTPQALQARACRGLVGLVVGFIAGRVDGSVVGAGVDSGPAGGEPEPIGSGTGTDPAVDARSEKVHGADPGASLRFSLELFARALAPVP